MHPRRGKKMKDHYTKLYSWLDNKVLTYSTKSKAVMGPAEKLIPESGIVVSNIKWKMSTPTPNGVTLTRTAEPKAPMVNSSVTAKHARSPIELSAQRVDAEREREKKLTRKQVQSSEKTTKCLCPAL